MPYVMRHAIVSRALACQLSVMLHAITSRAGHAIISRALACRIGSLRNGHSTRRWVVTAKGGLTKLVRCTKEAKQHNKPHKGPQRGPPRGVLGSKGPQMCPNVCAFFPTILSFFQTFFRIEKRRALKCPNNW